MIDIDRYEIDDDVVWIWKWSDDAYDDEKKRWVSGVEHANWQLWEYKECPAEKGGYEIYRKGEDDESTHEPWNQLLPEIPSIEWNKKMEAIQDVPFLIKEVKRLQEENKKQLDVLSTLDEMIRYGNDHVEMMKALEQGLDLPETWKEMIE